ncbi:hypothetical protein lbkm_2405 [Lachnospiraceae bacterium KM106-2]|nr:hypothetical protein lbkm_2405 [Lachnospiraceae bacterium KM106-2]
MDQNIQFWFHGFEKGIEKMEQPQRELIFRECGKNCANNWALNVYKEIYHKVNGDLDEFFQKMNEIEDVRTEIVESRRKYYLCFERCVCSMHKEGYLNSPCLCECSRQSVLYVMTSLMPETKVEVTMDTTVLRGGKECRILIEIMK